MKTRSLRVIKKKPSRTLSQPPRAVGISPASTMDSDLSHDEIKARRNMSSVENGSTKPDLQEDQSSISRRTDPSERPYASEIKEPIVLPFTDEISDKTSRSANANAPDLLNRVRTFFITPLSRNLSHDHEETVRRQPYPKNAFATDSWNLSVRSSASDLTSLSCWVRLCRHDGGC